jgi:ABC-type Na+ efflux pump permease subunit
MNRALFEHTWRTQRIRLAIVGAGLAAWGFLMPVVYATFGADLKKLFDSGLIPKFVSNFGGGDIFSLGGSIALGFIHPIAVFLVAVFAVGWASAAVAGERQRGTLEILLARPVSRRSLFATVLATLLAFVALLVAAHVGGTVAGAALFGVLDDLPVERLPLLWLNGVLLYGALAAISLAASVSFDRLTPAIGAPLTLVIVMYVFEVLGSLWPDAEGLQPYSLFHYLAPRALLAGTTPVEDLLLLAAVGGAAGAYALVVFPRRDIAAPS